MKTLKKSIFLSFSYLSIITLFNIFFIYFKVEGQSMYPTLKNKEKYLAYKCFDKLNRFDIVIIKKDNDKRIIKRIIALPNEKVSYRDNKLFINDIYIEEYFLNDNINTNAFDIMLKEDEYLCLGDNREMSIDSRKDGPYNISNIIAKCII